jgi:hypothetical protein
MTKPFVEQLAEIFGPAEAEFLREFQPQKTNTERPIYMDKLPAFARVVAAQFQDILKSNSAFVADIDADAFWELYLASFPEGTNPLFKKRTEHDCSTCKQFVRHAGRTISIKDGKVSTVWDVASQAHGPYFEVAAKLAEKLRQVGVRDIFRVGKSESQFGAIKTHSLDENKNAVTWNHLHTGPIPRSFQADSPDAVRGDYRTTVQVFERGLAELQPEAIDTVLELIQSNGLYRGAEHKGLVQEFQKRQRAYRAFGTRTLDRQRFVWENADNVAVARFRSTVIGTLVQDLSEGKGLEHSVQSFETKVAPQNYKRTTSLVTESMAKAAMKTIEELGLEPALERRYAVIGDVSVNDVLWADGTTKPLMKGGVADLLAQHVASTRPDAKGDERAEEIFLEDFMKMLPEVQSMEVFFAGRHTGNLMALTAPVHPEPKQLFKWNNDFAWSYGGNVADSIKERVKKAGGRVDGALRISLSWFNYDDLDLHVHEPAGRGARSVQDHIFFGNKMGWTGGNLDVDMNAGHGTTRTPVENVVWPKAPPDGAYRVIVNNYNCREVADPGFVVEVECGGKLTHYSYNKPVRGQANVSVLTLHMKNGQISDITVNDAGISASNISQEKWGLSTEKYVKVKTVMLSPNYWGENKAGNQHTFLVLEGAKSDEDMRGFYNEFLHQRLEPHRKVFEVIGDKTKCRPTEGQLAGLGFSHTKEDVFRVRVQQGKRQRILDVHVV